MNISRRQCEEFRANPTVNPLTGRVIQVGKVRHRELSAACAKYLPGASVSSKGNDYQIPPMGPMIHWRMDGEIGVYNNMIDFLKFIQPTVKELEQGTGPISKMWLDELHDILVEAKDVFHGKPAYVKTIDKILGRLETIRRSRPTIDDLPKINVIAEIDVKPKRVFIRGRVLRGYSLYDGALRAIEESLHIGYIRKHVGIGQIKDVLRYKTYCDYLIKHKIFSHDDIYKRVYPGENAFDELKKKYTEYRKLYKQEKGESMIGKWPL